MAIDPKLLVIKPVNELESVAGLQAGELLFYDGSDNLKKIDIDTFNNLSKTAKPLKPTDATPTEEGLYMPTESGEYANADGLISQEGYYTLFFFDGTNWTKSESKFPEGIILSPEFNPTTETEAQGGKQINDYLFGSAEEITNILPNTYVNPTWQNIASAGNNMIKIDVVEGERISVSGLNNTNTAFNAVLRTSDHSLADQRHTLIEIQKDFSIVIPHGYDGFLWVSNGDMNWKLTREKTGKINNTEYSIALKNVSWANGNWGANGEDVTQSGVRKTPIFASPKKIKIQDFNNSEVDLKFYSATNKYIGYITLENDIQYDLTGFPKYTIVVVGVEGAGKIFEYSEKKQSGGGGTETINIFDYNGVGTGGDDTPQFNLAVNQLVARGGGRIILPNNGQFNVGNIDIPPLIDDWITVEFDGIVNPALRFGTVGTYPNINQKRGATLNSFSSDPAKGVIHVNPYNGGFSAVHLVVKNLNIRVPQNPNTSGIFAHKAYSVNFENIDINTGIYNVQSVQPTNNTSGIITPAINNAAYTVLKNISVNGFMNGIEVNEHTDGDNIIVSSCINGLLFNTANHASLIKRSCLNHNTKQISVVGSHPFEIQQMNMEYIVGSSEAWRNTTHELYDPNNYGIGQITYANTKGNVGKVDSFVMDGASNLIVKKLGSETRLTGAGIPRI